MGGEASADVSCLPFVPILRSLFVRLSLRLSLARLSCNDHVQAQHKGGPPLTLLATSDQVLWAENAGCVTILTNNDMVSTHECIGQQSSVLHPSHHTLDDQGEKCSGRRGELQHLK